MEAREVSNFQKCGGILLTLTTVFIHSVPYLSPYPKWKGDLEIGEETGKKTVYVCEEKEK